MSGIARKLMGVTKSASTSWDVSNAVYNGYPPLDSFSVVAQESGPQGLFFKPDGTKMYVLGSTGDDVNEYDLVTAWDISTASYLQNFSVAAQEVAPSGVFFKPDGTKMYVVGSTGGDINEYGLLTAWDITTSSYLQNFSVASQETTPQDVFFKPDGTKMYVIGYAAGFVNEYDLLTAWDITTSSYLQRFTVTTQENTPRGLFFKSDGTKMYVVGTNRDLVLGYTLSTAWDLSTAVWVTPATEYFSVAAQEAGPTSVFFKPDGTKMYIMGTGGDDVNEYDLVTAWDISTASYLQNFTVATQENTPQGLFFKPDGTKMYIVGATGDDVNEYNLLTAWNVTTSSYLQNFSVAAQETTPTSVFFKPDGTKMYIIGSVGDDVNEYDLLTAWDVTTSSYLQNFSFATLEGIPTGIFFKPDGTKMYIIGYTGDKVYEYNLSTAWNVTTSSYLQNFSVVDQEEVPQDVFFKPDGTKMYVVGSAMDAVFSYDL